MSDQDLIIGLLEAAERRIRRNRNLRSAITLVALALVFPVVLKLIDLFFPLRGITVAIVLGLWAVATLVWIVLRKAMAQLALGLLVGFFGTMLWSRAFSGTGVAPSTGPRFDDPLTLASVTAMLVAVTGLATAWPALCASRIDPAVVLRSE